MTGAMTGPWVTRAQAAELLAVSPRTVNRWMNAGVIPMTSLKKTGKRYRISLAWCQGRNQ